MANASYHSMSILPKFNDKVGVMKDWLKNNLLFPPKLINIEV